MTKRFFIVAVLTALIGAAAFAGRADARPWPSSCATFRCANVHLNNLNARAIRLQKRVVEDEGVLGLSLICTGDALVNATNDGVNTGLPSGLTPLGPDLGIDCETDWWSAWAPTPSARVGHLRTALARLAR